MNVLRKGGRLNLDKRFLRIFKEILDKSYLFLIYFNKFLIEFKMSKNGGPEAQIPNMKNLLKISQTSSHQ